MNLAILLLVLFGVGRFVHVARRWWGVGRPTSISRSWRGLGRLAVDLTLTIALIVLVLEGFAKISFAGLMEFYPDLGIALVLSVALGMPQSAMQATLRSAHRATSGS